MRKLTHEELSKAPADIRYIHEMIMSEQLVPLSIYESCMDKYPEYFPKEIENAKKWKSIPQEVHDKYWEEFSKSYKEIMKNIPLNKGMGGWIDDPEGYKEWCDESNKAHEEVNLLREKLHNKYYSKYGVNAHVN